MSTRARRLIRFLETHYGWDCGGAPALKCPDGHIVGYGAKYCSVCGKKTVRNKEVESSVKQVEAAIKYALQERA